MANSYRPAYYSSIQHSLTSIYKSIFKSNRRRLLTDDYEHKQSEALKWQQDQFHKILHLTALHREGIVDESQVSAFRATLLESIAAAPPNQESPHLTRDKLLFLQELLHSKCISSEEYHTFKRPLLQRLAILGEEISSQDIKIGNPESVQVLATQMATQEKEKEKEKAKSIRKELEEEEWSVIDLEDPNPTTSEKEKPKHKNPIKQLINPHKSSKNKETKNETKPSILTTSEKGKRREREGGERKSWGLDGFKRWRKVGGHGQEEQGTATATATAPCLDELERSDFLFDNVQNAVATNHSDKVLGDNIKKELSWIKTELSATNRNVVHFSDEQVEAISTKLPMDKSDLNSYFPKAWCDRHGDTVLEVVQKELKERVTTTVNVKPRNGNHSKDSNAYNKDWVHFDDSENFHPNLFVKGNGRDNYINPFL